MQELRLVTPPGAMVIFNGNTLWHAIIPLKEAAERVVLTMEYVTNPQMNPVHRFVSNMKDAIAYFGFSTVLRGLCRADLCKDTKRVSRPPHLTCPSGSASSVPVAHLCLHLVPR